MLEKQPRKDGKDIHIIKSPGHQEGSRQSGAPTLGSLKERRNLETLLTKFYRGADGKAESCKLIKRVITEGQLVKQLVRKGGGRDHHHHRRHH